VKFDWDKNKANTNYDKHKVYFEEAKSVFYDFLSFTISDKSHSINEERYITIGMSVLNRILVVVHSEKEDTIRIISSRLATKQERKKYEEGY
jgi:uncharacterized DUF497 family protein